MLKVLTITALDKWQMHISELHSHGSAHLHADWEDIRRENVQNQPNLFKYDQFIVGKYDRAEIYSSNFFLIKYHT